MSVTPEKQKRLAHVARRYYLEDWRQSDIARELGISRPMVSRLLADENYRLFAIDAINLLESGVDRLCDKTVAITSPLELRVRRIMARDNISEQYARLRISAQKPDEYYRTKCDYELNNGADTAEAFEAEAREFFERLAESIKEEKAHGEQ